MCQDLYKEDPSAVEQAITQLLLGSTKEKSIGLRVAFTNRIYLSENVLTTIFDNEEGSNVAVEMAGRYCEVMNVTALLPKMNEMLRDGKSGILVQTILEIGDLSSKEALAEVYEKLIANNPSRRAKYQALQALWAVAELPQVINALPEKTKGVYFRKSDVGTAFPVSDEQAPTCQCCQEQMVSLFYLPQEADLLEMPVYHCPRCNFDSPIFLDLQVSPPQWIGECFGQPVDFEDQEDVEGGTIAWGVDVQGAEKSKTFIGGNPDWAQEKETFDCPKCEQKMEFVLQLESDYTLGTGLYFFHGGIMYVHRCRECQVACYFFQTS